MDPKSVDNLTLRFRIARAILAKTLLEKLWMHVDNVCRWRHVLCRIATAVISFHATGLASRQEYHLFVCHQSLIIINTKGFIIKTIKSWRFIRNTTHRVSTNTFSARVIHMKYYVGKHEQFDTKENQEQGSLNLWSHRAWRRVNGLPNGLLNVPQQMPAGSHVQIE